MERCGGRWSDSRANDMAGRSAVVLSRKALTTGYTLRLRSGQAPGHGETHALDWNLLSLCLMANAAKLGKHEDCDYCRDGTRSGAADPKLEGQDDGTGRTAISSFENGEAALVCGGIGAKAARRATETAAAGCSRRNRPSDVEYSEPLWPGLRRHPRLPLFSRCQNAD